MDQIVLDPERKILDAWNWSQNPKFEFRLHSPDFNYCGPCSWLLSASFLKQVANWLGKSYGVSTGLIHVKTIVSLTSVVILGLSTKFPKNAHCTWSNRLTIRDNIMWQGLDHHYGNRWKVPGGGIAFAYVS